MTGESASAEVVSHARSVLASDPRVVVVEDLLSMHLGPNDILLAVSIDFRDEMTSTEIEAAARELTTALKKAHSDITRVFLRPVRRTTAPPQAGAEATRPGGSS